jgi:hypothetical protein
MLGISRSEVAQRDRGALLGQPFADGLDLAPVDVDVGLLCHGFAEEAQERRRLSPGAARRPRARSALGREVVDGGDRVPGALRPTSPRPRAAQP